MSRIRSFVIMLAMACGVSACGPTVQDNLRNWMAEQRKATIPQVKKIAPPKPFTYLAYDEIGGNDPFAKQFLINTAIAEYQKQNPDLSLAHKGRERDPLENFAVEAMSFVGTLEKQGRTVGLVRVQGQVYQVLPGQYLGKNFGKIIRIDESAITLRELAQNQDGKWAQRDTNLRIQGGVK